MEVVSSCIIHLGGKLWDPLKRQVQYINDLKENVQHLLREREELLAQQEDVIQRVDRERLRLAKLSNQNEVNHWMENVNKLKEQLTGIEKIFGEDKRCLNGCLPNYCSHRKYAKETQRLIREGENLRKNKPSIDVDAYQVTPARLLIPTESFKGATAKMVFRSIRDCLIDEKIAKIGVYGMGGVGKMTIIKNIKNSLHQENIFSEIVFVTVSRCFDLKAIQKEIAKQIALPMDEDCNEETLSSMLHEALQRRTRFLLILDDLWSELPLKDIGIPEPHADCKVVLTTRLYEVCQCMGTHKEIKVEVLSPEDAWSLFQENVCMDDVVHDPKVKTDPELTHVSEKVAQECGGLPLAIITVGRALRGENNVGVWRDALNQLRHSTANIPGMEEGVIKKLKLSFDRLKFELRTCFLYCSLFPEDYKIRANVLIDHWIWDGLIHRMENKQAEVDNGRSLLNKLKLACLLEFDDGSDTVKMHDLMRDMAIHITKHNPRFMVKAGFRLEEAPAENEWPKDVERISFMKNKIKRLSGQPRCPRLRTLLLNYNYSLSEIIPHSFFDKMRNLRVIDLTGACIEMLPDSICNLKRLHVLLLIHCERLKKMPSLEKLKELRVLHVSYALVEEMPQSLASLENLLELNLEGCNHLKTLPSFAKLEKLRNSNLSHTSIENVPQSLTGLTNLEELNLEGCNHLKTVLQSPQDSAFVELEKLRNLNVSRTSIENLPQLTGLTNLEELNLSECSKLKRVPSFMNLKKLKRLHISKTCIEELPRSLSDLEKIRELVLDWNEKVKMVPSFTKLRDLMKLSLSHTCIEELPESLSDLENLHELDLYDCKNLKRVPSLEKAKQLRILNLASTGIEELPEGMEMLVALESLDLSHTKRLRRFPHGILPKLSLLQKFSTMGSSCLWSSNVAGTKDRQIDCKEITGLTRLTAARFDCDNLPSFFDLFKLLEESVLQLRAVIKSSQPLPSEFEDETFLLEFHRKNVEMKQYSEIKIREQCDIICLSDFLLRLGSVELDACYINSCDGLQFVLARQDNYLLPKLKILYMDKLPNLESLYRGTMAQGTLAMLAKIKVSACPKLSNLLSLQLMQSLQNLKSIEVKDCDTMEELIVGDDDESGRSIIDIVLELQVLVMSNLPALKSICCKPLVCNSLRRIEIKQCPHLKKFPLRIDTLYPSFSGNFEGEKEWWDVLDWHDPTNTKLLLQPFFNDNQEKGKKKQQQKKKRKKKKKKRNLIESSESKELRQDASFLGKDDQHLFQFKKSPACEERNA